MFPVDYLLVDVSFDGGDVVDVFGVLDIHGVDDDTLACLNVFDVGKGVPGDCDVLFS